MTIQLRIRWSPQTPSAGVSRLIACLACIVAYAAIFVLVTAPSASAASAGPIAHASRQPTAVAARVVRDKRRLAHEASALQRCLRTNRRHSGMCGSRRHAVEQTSGELAQAVTDAHRSDSDQNSTGGSESAEAAGTGGSRPGGSGAGADAGSTTEGAGTPSPSGSGAGGESQPVSTGSGSEGEVISETPSPTPTEPSPIEPPAATPPIGGGHLEIGVNAGSALEYERTFIEKLGAHTARMAFGINETVAEMEPIIEAYARAGIKPLLLACFTGYVPSAAEAKNVASWAAAFGPGGTFWKGKSFPSSVAVTDIEFGNETNYSYQFSEDTPAAYATRAQTYATRVKEAHEAIQATHSEVGILAQGNLGNAGVAWVQNMFKAVPNLGRLVAGWTIHPYGPNWEQGINATISATQAVGAPSTIPIYVTEWGLSSDNGRCLEYNFGFNDCMTYSEAASTLASNVAAMRAKYGSRLGGFYIYQAHDQKPTGGSTEMEGYFGGIQLNGEAKGAYTTEVESLLAEDV